MAALENDATAARPTLTDVQRVVRDACRNAGFKRRGLEACLHIVRRNSNRLVHAAFDLGVVAAASPAPTAAAWRAVGAAAAAAPAPKATLSATLCNVGLSFTSCPPTAVDTFILPDDELWQLTDAELLELSRRQEAMRRGPTDSVPDPISDAVAAAAAAAGASVRAPAPTPLPPRPRPRWAERHEYATAVDEAVEFDDDDSDDLAREHHDDDPEMERIFKEAAAANNLVHHNYHDEL